jgi:hypothetical protein
MCVTPIDNVICYGNVIITDNVIYLLFNLKKIGGGGRGRVFRRRRSGRKKSRSGAGWWQSGALRWRWDFPNPLVLNGFRGFWHCHVPSRANGLLRAGV